MFSRNGKNHNDARYCIHIRAGRELQFSDNAATGKVYVRSMARKDPRPAKAPSAAMVAQRERFAAIVKMVQQMRAAGSKKSRKQLWKIAAEAYDAACK